MKPLGIVCLDGGDGTGKSTLAQHFVDEYGAVRFHSVYRFKKMIPSYHEVLLRKALAVRDSGGLAVLDRHYITEAIYAGVFRGGTAWPTYTWDMDARFEKEKILTVLCVPGSIDEALDRKRRRAEEDPSELEREKPVNGGIRYDDTQLRQLYSKYQQLWDGFLFADGDDRVAHLTRTGGVWYRPDFVQYRIEVEGVDMPAFARSVLKKLKKLQRRPEC